MTALRKDWVDDAFKLGQRERVAMLAMCGGNLDLTAVALADRREYLNVFVWDRLYGSRDKALVWLAWSAGAEIGAMRGAEG